MTIEVMKQVIKEAVYHRGGYWIVPEKEFESLRQAIAEAEKQEPKPCPTCEALARTVLMDQGGTA